MTDIEQLTNLMTNVMANLANDSVKTANCIAALSHTLGEVDQHCMTASRLFHEALAETGDRTTWKTRVSEWQSDGRDRLARSRMLLSDIVERYEMIKRDAQPPESGDAK
ncbi:MAG: hypothetical protein IAG10_08190 [Planctomycetaceae bacterium]|nr:hypothetical protein [Planctomycetaceae bacterium]